MRRLKFRAGDRVRVKDKAYLKHARRGGVVEIVERRQRLRYRYKGASRAAEWGWIVVYVVRLDGGPTLHLQPSILEMAEGECDGRCGKCNARCSMASVPLEVTEK